MSEVVTSVTTTVDPVAETKKKQRVRSTITRNQSKRFRAVGTFKTRINGRKKKTELRKHAHSFYTEHKAGQVGIVVAAPRVKRFFKQHASTLEHQLKTMMIMCGRDIEKTRLQHTQGYDNASVAYINQLYEDIFAALAERVKRPDGTVTTVTPFHVQSVVNTMRKWK